MITMYDLLIKNDHIWSDLRFIEIRRHKKRK